MSATDLTNEFIDILKLELEKFKPKKAEFVKVFEIHFVSAQFYLLDLIWKLSDLHTTLIFRNSVLRTTMS